MAMTWKLGLLNLSPRLLNFHNSDRVFSDAHSLNSPSGEPPLIPPSPSLSSLIQAKLAKFSGFGETGREERGPFSKSLHRERLDYIRSRLCAHFRRDPLSARPFEGLKFIAVGCGGGILSESLARMGATVTGIDAVEEKIKKARLHSYLDPVTSRIEYHCTTAAKLVEEQKSFDAVLALEVLQHVENPAEFCKSLSALTVPDGAVMISFTSAYTIVDIASFLLHWLPNGTPQWLSVIDHKNLVLFMERASITVSQTPFIALLITGTCIAISTSALVWLVLCSPVLFLWLYGVLGEQTSLLLVPKQKHPSKDQNIRSAWTKFDDS